MTVNTSCLFVGWFVCWWLLFSVSSVLLPPGQPFCCHTAASSWRRPRCQTQGGQNSKPILAEQHKHWLNTQKRNVFFTEKKKRQEYYSRTTKLELFTTSNTQLTIKLSYVLKLVAISQTRPATAVLVRLTFANICFCLDTSGKPSSCSASETENGRLIWLSLVILVNNVCWNVRVFINFFFCSAFSLSWCFVC